MRTVALASLVLVGTASAAPRTKGKVVRVERSRSSQQTPRICEVRTSGEGTCFGAEPRVGEVVMVLDEETVVAEVRLTEVVPFQQGSTGPCAGLWNTKGEYLRGDALTSRSRGIGVIDAEIHPQKGRILEGTEVPPSPSGNTDDRVSIAVDRDGDRVADILLVQSNCGGSGSGGTCLDEWARVNGKMVRVQQTNFMACGF